MSYSNGIFLGLCLVFLTWISDLQSSSFDDLEVIFAPSVGRTAHAFLKSRKIQVKNIRRHNPKKEHCQSTISLYDSVRDEMLAGYRFIPEIDNGSWHDEAWWSEDLRDKVCTRESFYSDQLKLCCESIATCLDTKSMICNIWEKDMPKSWKDLDAQCVSKNFYQAGATRLWTVVPASVVGSSYLNNQIFLRFYKADTALRGVLVQCAKEIGSATANGETQIFYSGTFIPRDWAQDSKIRNLLALMKMKEDEKTQCASVESCSKKAASLDLSPSLENILHPGYAGQWDVCLEYHPRPGVCRSGFFLGKEFAISTDFWEKGHLSQVLRREILKGFYVKNAEKLSHEDVRTLKRPDVRDIVCTRISRESETMQICLNALCGFWHAGFRYDGSDLLLTDIQDLLKATEKNAKIVWSILDKEELKQVRSGAKVFKERTLLIGVQSEEVALKGSVVQVPIWERWSRGKKELKVLKK